MNQYQKNVQNYNLERLELAYEDLEITDDLGSIQPEEGQSPLLYQGKRFKGFKK